MRVYSVERDSKEGDGALCFLPARSELLKDNNQQTEDNNKERSNMQKRCKEMQRDNQLKAAPQ